MVEQDIPLYYTLRYLYYLLVKYCVSKPLNQLCYIVNGVALGEPKWYQRKHDGKHRWRWLGQTSYRLTKHVVFDLKPN